jgi:hypothetical protein
MSTFTTKVKDTLRDFAARMSAAKGAVQMLHETDRALRDEHAAALAERSRIAHALPPLAEIRTRLAAEVDRLGREWRRSHASDLAAVARPEEISLAAGARFANAIGAVDLGFLCALLGDSLKASLAVVVNGAAGETGPALADRPGLIADLDKRIADLEREHAALCDEARAAGITLELLDVERGRRHRAEQHARFVRDQVAANGDGIRRGTITAQSLGVMDDEFARAKAELGL